MAGTCTFPYNPNRYITNIGGGTDIIMQNPICYGPICAEYDTTTGIATITEITGWFYKIRTSITFEPQIVEPSLDSHSKSLGEL